MRIERISNYGSIASQMLILKASELQIRSSVRTINRHLSHANMRIERTSNYGLIASQMLIFNASELQIRLS